MNPLRNRVRLWSLLLLLLTGACSSPYKQTGLSPSAEVVTLTPVADRDSWTEHPPLSPLGAAAYNDVAQVACHCFETKHASSFASALNGSRVVEIDFWGQRLRLGRPAGVEGKRNVSARSLVAARADEAGDVNARPDDFSASTAKWVVFYNIKSGDENKGGSWVRDVRRKNYVSRIWNGDEQSFCRRINLGINHAAYYDYGAQRCNGQSRVVLD